MKVTSGYNLYVKSYGLDYQKRYITADGASKEQHIESLEKYMSQFQDIFNILEQFI